MNAISNFTFHEKHNVRVQLINGEPWFCLSDVCKVLTVDRSSDLVRSLDEKGMVKNLTPTNGGNQNLNYVNEPNLYRIIFRSNKSEAKQFQDWVFNEVLPSIRKTGKYDIAQSAPREYIDSTDMQKIKRLVMLCTHHVGRKEAFTKAIHYALRQATGVPSPNRFEIQHLPILAREFQRIFSIVEPYFNARDECETLMMKHLLRENAPIQLLDGLLGEMRKSVNTYSLSKNEQLTGLFNADCLALMNRSSSSIG